jgi:hypothetical protein
MESPKESLHREPQWGNGASMEDGTSMENGASMERGFSSDDYRSVGGNVGASKEQAVHMVPVGSDPRRTPLDLDLG